MGSASICTPEIRSTSHICTNRIDEGFRVDWQIWLNVDIRRNDAPLLPFHHPARMWRRLQVLGWMWLDVDGIRRSFCCWKKKLYKVAKAFDQESLSVTENLLSHNWSPPSFEHYAWHFDRSHQRSDCFQMNFCAVGPHIDEEVSFHPWIGAPTFQSVIHPDAWDLDRSSGIPIRGWLICLERDVLSRLFTGE